MLTANYSMATMLKNSIILSTLIRLFQDFAKYIARIIHGGIGLTAAIGNDSVIGVQFHPEKSGNDGLQLLTNQRETDIGLVGVLDKFMDISTINAFIEKTKEAYQKDQVTLHEPIFLVMKKHI